MKYDREWLDSIHETEALIKRSPCADVPFPHRPYIVKQMSVQVERFRYEFDNGRDTSLTQRHILDLTYLAIQLIEEANKRRAEADAAYAQ